MKVAAVVPMKLNNRRLPQKNTRPFTNGRPLCWYILSTLLEVEAIEKVYVYCSNPSIQEYLPQGVEYLRRGEDLDQDSTKMNEVLARFAGEVPADVYVMTHTTAPFVRKESIEKGLEAVLSGAYDSAFAVKELRDGFYIYRQQVITQLGRRIGEKPKLVTVSEVESVDIDEAEDFLIADALYNYGLQLGKGACL